MIDATGLALARRRGRRRHFDAKKLAALLAYLDRPESTIPKAAAIFACSPSTIEKALKRVRDQPTDR